MMRVVRTKEHLNRAFKPLHQGVVSEVDVSCHPTHVRSDLRVKVLFFRSKKALRDFWRNVMRKPEAARGNPVAVVTPLGQEWIAKKNGVECFHELRVDPRYVAVMGLVVGYLTMEILSHESVHAAFAYAGRVKTRNPWADLHDFHEEWIAYPSGIIAAQINRFCDKSGLYSIKRMSK